MSTASVTTVTAADQEDATLVYSLSGGASKAQFSWTASGALAFKAAPDFMDPQDTDKNNVYEVAITVSDDGNHY